MARLVCESLVSINISDLKKIGLLNVGQIHSGHFSHDGVSYGEALVVCCHDSALSFVFGWGGEQVERKIQLATSMCHFGGARQWFICPRCFDNKGLLYFNQGYFACRICLRLGYQSKLFNQYWRADYIARKLERKLSKDGTKPIGMHWRTYDRLCDRISRLYELSDSSVILE